MSVPHLKGEEGIVKTKSDLPAAMKPSSIAPPHNSIPTPPQIPSPPPIPEPNQPTEKCIHKPSQCLQDIMEGCGSSSNWPSDPVVAHGVQLPIPLQPVTEQPSNEVFRGKVKLNGSWQLTLLTDTVY